MLLQKIIFSSTDDANNCVSIFETQTHHLYIMYLVLIVIFPLSFPPANYASQFPGRCD